MYEMLKEFIKPELLVMIPVLYLFGMGLKKSEIADKHIPCILGITSIVMCFIYIGATSVITGWQEILMSAFSSITQGILCAGASVYVNQFVKQSGKHE